MSVRLCSLFILRLFFFSDTATTEIYTLSLHDALPISASTRPKNGHHEVLNRRCYPTPENAPACKPPRSEEHTSELQSRVDLVCRLLLEKKNKRDITRGNRHRAA